MEASKHKILSISNLCLHLMLWWYSLQLNSRKAQQEMIFGYIPSRYWENWRFGWEEFVAINQLAQARMVATKRNKTSEHFQHISCYLFNKIKTSTMDEKKFLLMLTTCWLMWTKFWLNAFQPKTKWYQYCLLKSVFCVDTDEWSSY